MIYNEKEMSLCIDCERKETCVYPLLSGINNNVLGCKISTDMYGNIVVDVCIQKKNKMVKINIEVAE